MTAPTQSPPAPRKRADVALVERGVFESRARAQAAIAAGLVFADGKKITKASEPLAADAVIAAEPAHPYVSRGGVKLAGALQRYPVEIAGRVCLDVGASTGGFSDVLLRHGARQVFAVDVGHEQLHPSLRGHPNLVSMEGTDIRALAERPLPAKPEVVVIDASFISLKQVLPPALALAATPAMLLVLIKPQFEIQGRHNKRGIIKDGCVHDAVCADIAAFATSLGCREVAIFPSSIEGGDGNREFFLGARYLGRPAAAD